MEGNLHWRNRKITQGMFLVEHRRPSSTTSEVSQYINKDKPEHDGQGMDFGLVYEGSSGGNLHQSLPANTETGGDTTFQRSEQGWSGHMSHDLTKSL